MMFRTILAAALLLTGTPYNRAQHSERYVLLPSREVESIPTRKHDEVFKKTGWKPTATDIASLERSLPQITALQSDGWNTKVRIDHPEKYFRQYVAVSLAGTNLIYVNAFCEYPPPPSWRDQLYWVDDGATCYWQALYDPANKTFSHLTINDRG
jgi:hypothetical protein